MIKVGSQFSGVGAFRQALMQLDIKHKTVFACDMDKYARATYIKNYGTKKDIALLDHPDVKFCDDIYYRYADKKLKRPTISEYKRLLTIQEQTARLFSFYYPWNVNYCLDTDTTDIDIYSPPCQAFSLAGKRLGESDQRGILFYTSHKRIKRKLPRYFIFENVKGLLSDDKKSKKDDLGQTFTKWLTLLGGKSVNGNPVFFPHEDSVPYHIYWKVLNAKDYKVPQNRERVFIVGIRDDADNTFTWPKPYFLDKRLKDVLEAEVDNKYFLSDSLLKYFSEHKELHKSKGNGFKFEPHTIETHISNSISTKCGSRQTDPYIKIKSATKKGFEVAQEGDSINLSQPNSQPNSQTRRGRVGKEVAQTLDTACNQGVMIGALRGRNPENPTSRETGLPTEQRLELNINGTSNALTTVQKDNVVVTKNYIQWDQSGKGYKSQQDRVYFENGHMGCIPAGGPQNKVNALLSDYKIRRLTPRECFRLMGFPDCFKMPCSDTQMYKQAGNSIVVDVLAEIISKLKL